ncbi:MAG: glycosyltransferase family 2 protein [Acidimicrobiia bacterium]|nr:glycosyltransferase family 2 protein [Acidimicrobiia bacterium]
MKSTGQSHRPNDHPLVSIVMPARNERGSIAASIRSALDQEYEGVLEVVVADGSSVDGTRELLDELAAADDRLRVVSNPDGNTPAGLNKAILASRGEIVVRLDAHAVLPDGYVQRAVETLTTTGADNVGGIQDAHGETTLQRAIAMAMSSPLGVGDARFRYGGTAGPADTVYLGVFRRQSLEKIGFFDERLLRNQDYELNYRIRRAGGLVYFDPELKIRYTPRGTLGGLWRQYYQYGQGKRRMLRTHPAAIRWRQLAPPALIAGLAVSVVLAATPWRPLALVVPALYVSFIVGGSLWSSLKHRVAATLLLPVVLPTMHLAWGLGFLSR